MLLAVEVVLSGSPDLAVTVQVLRSVLTMVEAHKLPPDQQILGEDLSRIQGSVKQLSARVHAQTERASHEFDALRAELESVLERLREAQQQVYFASETVECSHCSHVLWKVAACGVHACRYGRWGMVSSARGCSCN